MEYSRKRRSIGLSRNEDLGYSLLLHNPHRNEPQTSSPPHQSSSFRPPSPEDIKALPIGSSDEHSTDSELDSARAQKKRKKSHEGVLDRVEGNHTSSPLGQDTESGELANEPSNIRGSIFSTSRPIKTEGDDEDLFPSQRRSSQRRRMEQTYVRSALRNIHKASQEPEEINDQASDLCMPNTDAMCTKADQKGTKKSNNGFKKPPMQSSRSERDDSTSPGGGPIKPFKPPEYADPNELTPVKKFVQPQQVPSNTTFSPTPKAQNAFRAPPKCGDYNELGTADMQGLLDEVKGKSDVPLKIRTSDSSIAESSLPSVLRDTASSSSISSPPSSPGGLEEVLSISSANGREPPPAVCPVCKEPVDFEFLEEFDGGKRLRSRDQLRFCKAHRARSARSEWSAKGFPEIDWQRFDQRMKKHHPVIDDILKGTRSSYYRNAFEQQIRSKKFRTMKEAYQDSASMEGLSPGYYGSKGARAMIDNIASAFASKIRRLAVSDKVIMTAGVAAYIQAVLAPELATLLVMDDMNVDAESARAILRDSVDVGNLLNEEEDEAMEVLGADDDSNILSYGANRIPAPSNTARPT